MSESKEPFRAEQDHHRRAFEIYNLLGPKRTYQAVAKQLVISLRTVKSWASAFSWQQRILEREAAVARRLADRVMAPGADESQRNLRIVRGALLRLAKAIAEGKVKTQLGDLYRLIYLEEHLLGKSDSPSHPARPPSVVIYRPDQGSTPSGNPPN